MSRFEAAQFPGDERCHIDLLIKAESASLRLTFVESVGMGEAEEIVGALNQQIEHVSFQLHSVLGGAETQSWREDVG